MLNTDQPAALDQVPRHGAVVIDIAGLLIQAERDALPRAGGAANVDVAVADWDLLFSAVKQRLRQTVGPSRQFEQLPLDAPSQVRAQVLQCVSALDQLHVTMVNHIDRCHQAEVALSDSLLALAEVRAELARVQASEKAARHLAVHDGLTSLPNGAGFRVRLAHVLGEAGSKGQAFAVLYIDLDGFKAVNDLHGHGTGDELLRIVAARLSAAVRAEDMVSRMGGDEFACLLWGAPPGRAALTRLAEHLFEAVSAPFQIGSLSLAVRPSIGIAMWPNDGLTAERLLANADAAMYSAKRQRSGHAFFDQGA